MPVLCHSSEEQQRFAGLFMLWSRNVENAYQATLPNLQESTVQAPKPVEVSDDKHRWWQDLSLPDFKKLKRLLWLATIGLLLVAILGGLVYGQPPSWQFLPLLLAVLLVYPLWWLAKILWQALRDGFFARHLTRLQPKDLQKFYLKGKHAELFHSAALTENAQTLRRHHDVPNRRLDIDVSLRKTIRAGGWFTPVWGQDKHMPEYLVLIDRISFRDHQAHLAESLLHQLRNEEVSIHRYYFDTSPRYCYPAEEHERNTTRQDGALPSQQNRGLPLDELLAHHENHRLLIFSDGDGLFSNGRPAAWLENLRYLQQPALFTPTNISRLRADLLKEQGLEIFPANPAGLNAFTRYLETCLADEETSGAAETPALLSRTLPAQWVSRIAPAREIQKDLMQQLRTYLGEAWPWFCACALYPELRWPLTLELGWRLLDEDADKLKHHLPKLARLPWLRHGNIPNWLRLAVVKNLERQEEKDLRALLKKLMSNGKKEPSTQEIALAAGLLSVWQRIKQRWNPSKNELRDTVLLDFLGGSLAVRVGREIKELLQKTQAKSELLWDKVKAWLASWSVLEISLLFFPHITTKQLYKKLFELHKVRSNELQVLADKFGDPLLLARYYIEPDCQAYNPADDDEEIDPVSILRVSAFNILYAFFQRRFKHYNNGGQRQMIVLADAGMGKTSLLLMLKLRHLTKFDWSDNYDCKLFKLGEDTLDHIKVIKSPNSTVLLLDALDQDPAAWDNLYTRLLKILDATKHFYRVVISCRTQFFPEVERDVLRSGNRYIKIGGLTCPILYLSWFNDRQVIEYLRKLGFNRERMEKAEHILSLMGSLRFHPTLLSFIEDLLDLSERNWTPYRIYEALVEDSLNREVVKLRYMDVTNRIKLLPASADLLHACVRVAEWMQYKGKREISAVELDNFIASESNIAWLRQFDIGGRSLLSCNSEGAFRFSHYSIQEFLIAYGLVNGIIQKGTIRPTEQIQHFLTEVEQNEFTVSKKEIKILFLTANPEDMSRLRIDRELRDIGDALERSKLRENITFVSRHAVRLADLQDILLREQPNIVHFSGHGSADGIFLENAQGQSKLVPVTALINLFKLFVDKLDCLVLLACYSNSFADAIAEHISYSNSRFTQKRLKYPPVIIKLNPRRLHAT
ncbi:hypothetical protein [Candidatus Venteria ishoeyi]|uniref:CHAT domain protein n=1 Tax=Candidatus Venteria ishoeyi TaxID=1899563 RepID=A0A1H6F9S5_9GAMM|nr:hypothetical protein [Candidatus Venteria ishoeyi]SEH06838.1 Uncharacterised protein [Candidatus Venteria ishoeyi]